MKKRIYIDMDDTLCDFTGAAEAIRTVSEGKIWYPQATYGFFAKLKPLPGAIDAFRRLEEHFEVYILTAPSYMNPMSYTEKRVWVEENLGLETTKNLILCRQKGLLKGDYLIDDHTYPTFEGRQILFGQPPFENWAAVLDELLPTIA